MVPSVKSLCSGSAGLGQRHRGLAPPERLRKKNIKVLSYPCNNPPLFCVLNNRVISESPGGARESSVKMEKHTDSQERGRTRRGVKDGPPAGIPGARYHQIQAGCFLQKKQPACIDFGDGSLCSRGRSRSRRGRSRFRVKAEVLQLFQTIQTIGVCTATRRISPKSSSCATSMRCRRISSSRARKVMMTARRVSGKSRSSEKNRLWKVIPLE